MGYDCAFLRSATAADNNHDKERELIVVELN